jgi:glycosyltransferase involved in cell wall biosynthesis
VCAVEIPEHGGRLGEIVDVSKRTRALARERFDLFHATHPHVWGYTRRPTVVTVHDVVQFDASAYRQTGLKARAFYEGVQRADHIIAVSAFTEARLHELYPRTVGKTSVVPSPPSDFFVEAGRERVAHDPSTVFTLVDMASPDPRKRAAWLRPLALLLEERGLRLVVAGAGTDSTQSRELIGVGTALGRVDDAELTRLLRTSACFVYLSAYEGQGLPPLEAMAAGLPVVAVANTAVREVVGPGGILVEERASTWDEAISGLGAEEVLSEVADACARIAADETRRDSLRDAALAQASTFTQSRFDEGLLAAYGTALTQRG